MSESILAVPTLSASSTTGGYSTKTGTAIIRGYETKSISADGPILLAYVTTDDDEYTGSGNGLLAGPNSTVSGDSVNLYFSMTVSLASCSITNDNSRGRTFLYTIIFTS